MSNTYLLATDGSDSSSKAIDYVVNHADPADDITVVHVVPNPAEGFLGNDYDPNTAEAKLTEAADEVTAAASERLREAGFEVNTVLPMGPAGEKICDLADNLDADTIVMGRQGRGTVSELLLGSVSHHVVHHAPCAVTTVPSA